MLLKFFLTLVSGSAFLSFVALLSVIFSKCHFIAKKVKCAARPSCMSQMDLCLNDDKHENRRTEKFVLAASVSLLVIFLFMPIGTLPQFAKTRYVFFIIIVFFLLSYGIYLAGKDKNIVVQSCCAWQTIKAFSSFLKFPFLLMIVFTTFSTCAYMRGVPGNIGSIDAYAAVPLWNIVGILGKAGMILFFLVLCAVTPSYPLDEIYKIKNFSSQFFYSVNAAVCSAITVSLILPWNVALCMGMVGLPMYAADFVFYWCKVFVVMKLVCPCVRGMFEKLLHHVSVFAARFIMPGICLLAVLFILFDTLSRL